MKLIHTWQGKSLILGLILTTQINFLGAGLIFAQTTSSAEIQALLDKIKKDLREADRILQKTKSASRPVSIQESRSGSWTVFEVSNARIYFTAQDQQKAYEIAQKLNTVRAEHFKRLGLPCQDWNLKVDIYLHADVASYSRITGQGPGSPGHSATSIDQGRVVSRRIDLRSDAQDLVRAVFVHELFHIVAADRFKNRPLPRCFDEGVAVLCEPKDKREAHYNNLRGLKRSGQRLFSAQQLLNAPDYPSGQLWGMFYAQSVSLTEFLSSLDSERRLNDFIEDALKIGFDKALYKWYGNFGIKNYNDLQQKWDQWQEKNIFSQ